MWETLNNVMREYSSGFSTAKMIPNPRLSTPLIICNDWHEGRVLFLLLVPIITSKQMAERCMSRMSLKRLINDCEWRCRKNSFCLNTKKVGHQKNHTSTRSLHTCRYFHLYILWLRDQGAVRTGWKCICCPYTKRSWLFLQQVVQRPPFFRNHLRSPITPALGSLSAVCSTWFLSCLDVHVDVCTSHAASGRGSPDRGPEAAQLQQELEFKPGKSLFS